MGILDDTQIKEMLSNPGSQIWEKVETTDVLKQQLESSYELYREYMSQFKEAIGAMNRELALEPDQTWTDTAQASTISRIVGSTSEKIKAQSKWQLYRVRFSQRAKERDQLFADLQKCNDRLTTLLRSTKASKEVARDRLSTKAILGSTALGQLWREASVIFRALSAVWKCDCQAQHWTKLLLEPRTKQISEVSLSFEKIVQSRHELRKIKISPGSKTSISIASLLDKPTLQGTIPGFDQRQRNTTSRKSSHIIRNIKPPTNSPSSRPPPSITLTAFEPTATPVQTQTPGLIKSLCLSLEQSPEEYCGYIQENESLYFVYKDPTRPVSSPDFITLDQLLRIQGLRKPQLRQRVTLAWILSSSFLQLLESPWLPASWQKSDIIFYQDSKQPEQYALDQPHLNNHMASQPEGSPSADYNSRMKLSSSLEMLGIVLLELCFGQLLKEQSCRTKYSYSGGGRIEEILDVAAAKEWQGDVENKVGVDYALAVGWCLGGISSMPLDNWRAEMLQKVVHPLESYHKCFSQHGSM